MRVDIGAIVERADFFVAAIREKSKSRAAHRAHELIANMPNPCWAETEPGCTIFYGDEREAAFKIEALRYSALTWLRALIDPGLDWEPDAEWPQPDNLIAAIRDLEVFAPQNASTS